MELVSYFVINFDYFVMELCIYSIYLIDTHLPHPRTYDAISMVNESYQVWVEDHFRQLRHVSLTLYYLNLAEVIVEKHPNAIIKSNVFYTCSL